MIRKAIFTAVLILNLTLTGATIVHADDAKIKALEDQLRQQQEQNQKIMEMLKNMQGQQGSTAGAARPAAADQQTPPDEPVRPSSAAPSPVVPPPADKFTPGWLACIMSLKPGEGGDDDLLLLGDKLGCFIASKELYEGREYMKIPGMPKDPVTGWKGEAFFETRESGRHSFLISFEANTGSDYKCGFAGGFIIEGNEIFNKAGIFEVETNSCDGSGRGSHGKDTKICGSFNGGADLEPGRYKVEFWFYNASKHHFQDVKNFTFSVYTKKPSDALPVPASKSMLVRDAK